MAIQALVLARLLGHSRSDAKRCAAELLDAFVLAEAAGRLVKAYSGGMRRRLDVAASIIVQPDLLFGAGLRTPTGVTVPRKGRATS
jgi:ABC-2 type transport system ATP-binding protein